MNGAFLEAVKAARAEAELWKVDVHNWSNGETRIVIQPKDDGVYPPELTPERLTMYRFNSQDEASQWLSERCIRKALDAYFAGQFSNTGRRPPLPIPSANYWFNCGRSDKFTDEDRLLYLENAVNDLEGALVHAIMQNIGDALYNTGIEVKR